MEVIRENEILLDNGTKNYIVGMREGDGVRTKTTTVLLNDEKEVITPEVKSIKFDQEAQMFLVKDKLSIDEYLTGSICYYINERGLPLGLCFFDVTNGFYSMNFETPEDYKTNYFNLKLSICKSLREQVLKKYENDIENCKKMALYMKRVDESENKI